MRYARHAFAAGVPWMVAPCGQVTGVLVPHHFVAAPLIAAALAGIRRPVHEVVLLVPDHRNASPHPISASVAAWRTASGHVMPARALAAKLVAAQLVAIDERAFPREHAVADLVPFIAHAFPRARLLPLRFRALDCDAGAAASRRLGRALREHLGARSLVIASVDFVHDRPAAAARASDEASSRALASLEPERACEVEADSRLALVTLLEHGRAAGAQRFIRLRRADSHVLGASDADAVVSYLTGYLTRDGPAPVSLVAAGDIMLGRSITARMRDRRDFRYPLAELSAPLAAADITLANLEAQFTSACPTRRRGLSLCATPKALASLTQAGIDVVSVGNNHALDFGRAGLDESVARLRSAGIAVAGYNGTVIIERRGTRFALLGYDAVKGPFSPRKMHQEIEEARQRADAVIVMMHWGREGHTKPNDLQQRLAHTAASAGATLLIGSHPHAVQPLQQAAEATVAFSLGNFVFDQREPATAREGALGVFTFCGGTIKSARLAPVSISTDGVPRLRLR